MNSNPENSVSFYDPDSNHKRKKKHSPKPVTAETLEKAGLFYLQRFAVSTSQFQKKMMEKIKTSCQHHKDQSLPECEKLLNQLIERLTDSGLLNDNAYTNGIITSMRRQGKSKRNITQKLKLKGIEQTLITDAFEQYETAEFMSPSQIELRAAVTLAKKKRLGPFQKEQQDLTKEAKNKKFEKEMSNFARAGFSYDITQKVINMPYDEVLEFLD